MLYIEHVMHIYTYVDNALITDDRPKKLPLKFNKIKKGCFKKNFLGVTYRIIFGVLLTIN